MIQAAVWMVYFFVVGACVGSFLNVVIYRLPKGESVVRPGSRCASCGTPVRWYHNIPIISYLMLRGRCAHCGVEFSPRYLLVEFLTGTVFAVCFVKFGFNPAAVIYMAFSSALLAVAFIDIDHMIIPDGISLPGIPIGLISAWLFLPLTIYDSLLGFFVGGGILFLLALAVPGGMGGGDIKLMGMVGAFLGLKGALITIFAGSFIGSIVGGFGILFYGKGRKSKIPFGPYLVMGALLALFHERELIRLYLKIFVY